MAKRIVLCCDGTWNTADKENEKGEPCVTNVVKLAYRTRKRTADTKELQVVYYDHGVGTGNVMDRMVGGIRGEGLEENIHDAYRFLIANYEPGDWIYIFGFSRGAFTARSIAGMIRKCGILRRNQVRSYKPALEFYRNDLKPTDPKAEAFRKEHAEELDTPIKCVGVWDTVGALGIPAVNRMMHRNQEFYDTALSSMVEHAYHAVAIDEHRRPFAPTLWNNESPRPAGKPLEQTWFIGAHSDVGGGYGSSESGLSDIALRWMMSRAAKAGLEIDEALLPTNPNAMQKPHDSSGKMYTFIPGINREVGASTNGNEFVHRSVVERWKADPKYRPESLKKHAAKLDAHAASLTAGEQPDQFPI